MCLHVYIHVYIHISIHIYTHTEQSTNPATLSSGLLRVSKFYSAPSSMLYGIWTTFVGLMSINVFSLVMTFRKRLASPHCIDPLRLPSCPTTLLVPISTHFS